MVNSVETGVVDAQIFNCLASQAAAARTQNGVLVLRVRFTSETTTTHGAELPYVWGMTNSALANYVMDTWGGFARDPENYLVKQGWPT
jgi:hypothetical protein